MNELVEVICKHPEARIYVIDKQYKLVHNEGVMFLNYKLFYYFYGIDCLFLVRKVNGFSPVAVYRIKRHMLFFDAR